CARRRSASSSGQRLGWSAFRRRNPARHGTPLSELGVRPESCLDFRVGSSHRFPLVPGRRGRDAPWGSRVRADELPAEHDARVVPCVRLAAPPLVGGRERRHASVSFAPTSSVPAETVGEGGVAGCSETGVYPASRIHPWPTFPHDFYA